MEPEDVFNQLKDKINQLKDKIIAGLRTVPYCDIKFMKTLNFYEVECRFIDGSSRIQFSGEYLTNCLIIIDFKNLHYSSSGDIASTYLANMYMLKARASQTINEYLSVLEELMKIEYPSRFEAVIEYLYRARFEELSRIITDYGYIGLEYFYRRDTDIIYSYIYISNDKNLELKIIRNGEIVEDVTIPMETVPKAFMSVTKYALKIFNPIDYLRLEEAVRELARLIKVERRSARDAVRELSEIRGYRDIFDP